MDIALHYNVLDARRRAMALQLEAFKDDFYLAGGTALALQIGHRISEDFDFFTSEIFDNTKLLKRIMHVFQSASIEIIQNEKDTLTLIMNGVKLSFFSVLPPPLLPLIDTEYFRIAPVLEIGAFKLSALLRAAYKDYVDLFFVLREEKLGSILQTAKNKYPQFDESVYLKALLSFDDIDLSPIIFVPGSEISPDEIFSRLNAAVQEYLQTVKRSGM